MMQKSVKFVSTLIVMAAILLVGIEATLAQPANDNFSTAKSISAVPFSDSVDITTATTEPDEPNLCFSTQQTVWYSYTPLADAVVRADPNGSNFYDTAVTVYRA